MLGPGRCLAYAEPAGRCEMSIQLPLLSAPASGLLPEPLGTIAGNVPFGDIPSFLMLLAVAPSMVMLVILVLYQLRGSRIDDKPSGERPGAAAKPRAEAEPENTTLFMRYAIEQLNDIATALNDAIPKTTQTPGQEASDATDSVTCNKGIAQLAVKVGKLSELASRMRDEEQALKCDAVDSQRNLMDAQLACESPTQNRHYLTFTLGDEQFAVSIQHIHGVVEAVQLVAEPGTPPKIRKAIRLQGALVPVIDLGARFGGQSPELGRGSRIVILDVPSGDRLQLIGVLVNTVGDVLELPAMQIEPPTASASRIRDDFTLGTIRVDSRPFTLLDIGRGFSANELVPRSTARPQKKENQPA